MYLREWLIYLGEDQRNLARRLGIADSTVAVAISRKSQNLIWIHKAAQLLGVPSEVLMHHPPDGIPDTNDARRARARALWLAAKRRLAAARIRNNNSSNSRVRAPDKTSVTGWDG